MELKGIDPLGMIDFDQWQHMIDLLCRLAGVKSAAITQLDYPEIEIFQVSENPGNPLYPGLRVELVDHYCEAVINEKESLSVSNALESERWRKAPELENHLISYLGYPLFLPNGEVFGTICVHDNKEHIYSKEIQSLMEQFKNIVESHFKIAWQAAELKAAFENVRQLEGMLPICAHCKKVRNDQGYWEMVERYLADRSNVKFSHSICPECAREHYSYYDPEEA